MSSPVFEVEATARVKQTAELMNENHIGSLLVKENDKYVGIITESDITRKVIAKGLDTNETLVSDIMTQPIISLDCHLPITKANAFMAEKRVRHLAITDEGQIVGILSVKDLVSFFANPRLR